MRAGERIAAAIGDNPRMALRAVYAIWGLLFCAAVLGLAAGIYAAFGLAMAAYFFVGLLAAGGLLGGYYLLSGALSRLARVLFPAGRLR